MAENYPVPPPPPQARKPVPPPPPRIAGSAPSLAPAAPMAKSSRETEATPTPRPAAGVPPMPGMPKPGPSPIEQRIQEIEKRFQDQEGAKQSLEVQLAELGKQLKDEHEKVILQSLKAKEEEVLSSKVEQQIREMQEKLRREKHEQEILESRSKAENQLKDLERRLTEERESWMVALKNQLKEREMIEQDVEKNLSRRLREAEERFQDEKNQWTTATRQKDEEISQLRRQVQLEAENLKEAVEEKEEQLEQNREAAEEQRRAYEREMQAELRAVQGQLDNQMRESSTWKAQIALLQTQLQQVESQRQEERSRAHDQSQRMEEDLKQQYVRRELERTQHWETIVAQLRSDKEAQRSAMLNREEEITRFQLDLAEQRRLVEIERARWKNEIDSIRQTAREEAVRNLPEAYEQRVAVELKKWEQQHQAVVQPLKNQLSQAVEVQKSTAAKLDVETRRAAQEMQTLYEQFQTLSRQHELVQASLQDEQAQRDSQTKQFMQRMAEIQLRESALREALQSKTQEAATYKEAGDRASAALETIRQENNELVIYKTQTEKELGDLRREIKVMAQTQLEWKNSVVLLQNERSQHEQEWIEKEKTWQGAQEEWKKTIAELEKAKAEATAAVAAAAAQPVAQTMTQAPVGPEAAKALTAIRQQMQEMQTLLTWLRPVKKQPLSKAA
jgi:epidermal growth factor receptor substrate 15